MGIEILTLGSSTEAVHDNLNFQLMVFVMMWRRLEWMALIIENGVKMFFGKCHIHNSCFQNAEKKLKKISHKVHLYRIPLWTLSMWLMCLLNIKGEAKHSSQVLQKKFGFVYTGMVLKFFFITTKEVLPFPSVITQSNFLHGEFVN